MISGDLGWLDDYLLFKLCFPKFGSVWSLGIINMSLTQTYALIQSLFVEIHTNPYRIFIYGPVLSSSPYFAVADCAILCLALDHDIENLQILRTLLFILADWER